MIRRLESEQGRLALWLPVALGVGVLLYFVPRFEPPLWWGGLALLPAGLALRLRAQSPLLAWAMALLACIGGGFALAGWHGMRAAPILELPRGAMALRGTVVEVDPLPGGLRLTLAEARWAEEMPPAARLIRVRLRANDRARPEPGDRVALRALIRPPSAPAYPGAWDFQRAAFFEGVAGSGFALGPLEIMARDGAAPPLSGLRARIEAQVMAALPGAAGAIAAALLTGGQSGIPPAEMQAMRDSGLAHLLSVSGLHIAIVMGLVFALARGGLALWPGFALRFGTKPVAAILALLAGGFYMVLTGSQVPMQRSFAMAALVTLALLVGRRALSPRVLAFAAVAVLVLQPAALLGPSFQMSFAAVLALIAAFEAARPWLMGGAAPRPLWQRLGLVLLGTLATSVIAGAATTPFGLHHFGRVQVYGVAANALAVPLTSFLVMPAGMLALLLMPFGAEGMPLALMGWGIAGILWVAQAVAAWPGAALAMAPLPGHGLALIAFGFCWLCLWRQRWRLLGCLPMALGFASWSWVSLPAALASADGRLFAFQVAGEVFFERRPGASRFTGDAWLRGFGDDAGTPLPVDGELAGGRIACTPQSCLLRDAAGAAAVLLLRPPMPQRGQRAAAEFRRGAHPACGTAPVILSPEPLRGDCPGSVVVDRFSAWRDGAHAVWLAPPRVVSDRDWRGDRPWVPPRPTPRAQTQEPPAETE
ncbi:ComEC/Rec2 family competence protein [Sediminicoccus sp. KRV36]|uniref:ComEC/Rec2 family competence protein n=1 Tax=Sediminicoccus sp. KRV36 TaxID=3133721 RepID=UPI00200FF51A|nr:ComEC/Rec2 family competence protein [Sediminicoccus rosea]UPY38715.1 ComEC family competence protein [Sediminicoccus rosea]